MTSGVLGTDLLNLLSCLGKYILVIDGEVFFKAVSLAVISGHSIAISDALLCTHCFVYSDWIIIYFVECALLLLVIFVYTIPHIQ